MSENTTALFEPFKSKNLALDNRVVMAPMTRTFSPENVPNDLNVEYYRRRAAGGVGLIITEGTCVGHKAANGYPNVPFIYGDEALAGWKKVVDAVHKEGGKIMPQLWHVGSVRRPGIEPDPEVPGYGPSGLVMPGKKRCHEMTESDIADVIAAFAKAAADSKAIGFDGVEIHGAHGYLLDQFFWGGLNERTDKWGGDHVGRTRFAAEIVKAIRAEVGADFPVILRWSQWKQQDYSVKLATSPLEMEQFLEPLTDAGVDIFHCSTRRFWEPEFEGSNLNLAGWTKKLTGKPTITVGSVGLDTAFAEEGQKDFMDAKPASLSNLMDRMEQGEFDLVAVGRALIANPDWANKVKAADDASLAPYSKEMLKELA
ncbi:MULTISPECIES: NADH:flavin oxidoreductase [Kordiimonas]|jgi:2,4-dienoyl-CoA reductase-like NADH-dependent reductase (Old Yellow Enzyme family)|uniref:NADH:flavin oxidoreductase n=1 Tax=Kordiimonas TaxID=288021 RepID=UPI002580AD3C|nr:NADH:flavin oxidoreductase [Kordiimonas sp. UBA4487]